jgi:hypothetical protein
MWRLTVIFSYRAYQSSQAKVPNKLIRQTNQLYILRRMIMNLKLTPPKEITFWIAVALGVLGLFSFLGVFTLLPIEAFWLVFIGFALLVVALLVKGL